MEQQLQSLLTIGDVSNDNIVLTAAGVACVSLVIYLLLLSLRPLQKAKNTGGFTMTKQQRALQVREIMSDKITDMLESLIADSAEEAVRKNKITREEANIYYRKCASVFKLHDLKPRKMPPPTPEEKKGRIKFRLIHGYKPVAIPGEKPPRPVKKETAPPKKKSLSDVWKSKISTAATL